MVMSLLCTPVSTGVVQLDAQGRVSGILEEEVRPPGLLFGLPTEELVGAKLDALLRLGSGQSASGLLNDSGVAKKSALKASSRKNKSVEKVSAQKLPPPPCRGESTDCTLQMSLVRGSLRSC